MALANNPPVTVSRIQASHEDDWLSVHTPNRAAEQNRTNRTVIATDRKNTTLVVEERTSVGNSVNHVARSNKRP